MTRIFKLSSLILSIFLLTGTCLLFIYHIGEKYFFDKLFYQKSPLHGYFSEAMMFSENRASAGLLLKSRMTDVDQLLTRAESPPNANILGLTDAGVYSIAVIGDSYVYGNGVKVSERFTEILENKLDQIRPTKVYNLGQEADDLLDNYAKYLLAKANLNIDLYIIAMVQNDFQLPSAFLNRYPNKAELYQRLKTYCPQPHYEPMPVTEDMTYEEDLELNDVPSSDEKYDNFCLLKQFVKDTSASLVIFLNLDEFLAPYQLTENSSLIDKYRTLVLDRYEKVVLDNNGYLIRSFPPNSEQHFEGVSENEGHPSRKTHEWYASVLYTEIVNNPRYGFNTSPN